MTRLSPPAVAHDGVPRVVLVDDDPAIRRLVTMVLEHEALDLVPCASVAQARTALRAGLVCLLLTDLMMPGETGHDLLLQLRDDASLPRPAHVAVFSAGLDAATQQRLQGLGVWRLLAKPVSMDTLLATVREALSGALSSAPDRLPALEHENQSQQLQVSLQDPAQVQRHQAIATYFAGDAALFHAYRRSCAPLFAEDLAQGQAGLARGDAVALRRLGHSLKSVLRTLGENAAADAAQVLDSAAQAADFAPPAQARLLLTPAWEGVRQRLGDVVRTLQQSI